MKFRFILNKTGSILKKNKRKLLYGALLGLFLFVGMLFGVSWYIDKFSKPFVTHDLDQLKKNKVGLLLGTSKYLIGGQLNPFFEYRVEAAVKLYKNNKVNFILVSGDNATKQYNEPIKYLEELIKRGIPKERVFLDYAGFRTLDSVIRAWKVFGLKEFTVISQEFHNNRAIFIARKNGLDAVAFNAQGVPVKYSFKTFIREKFARIKMLLDLYIFDVQPKYLGRSIEIK